MNRVYSFQRQCNYLKESGAHPICFPCSSNVEILASGLSNCMSVALVRFFTYTIENDPNKTDDPRNFHAILSLENFDINTSQIPNFQNWLETNIIPSVDLSAYGPSFLFESIDPNRAPTGDNKISLPFKIQLTTSLPSSLELEFFFTSYSIV